MYQPSKRVEEILDRAWSYIESVNYKVSIRWVFYKLLQDGYFSSKSGYNNLKGYLSQARKRWYKEWRPDTLSDETRSAIYRGFGRRDEEEVMFHFPDLAEHIDTKISHFWEQDYYVELWFEAKAMIGQFEYYSEDVTLRPFGGDPSIPFKYDIAESMSSYAGYYGKPIHIIYFGDYDKKGLEIFDSAVKDIARWSRDDFSYERYGLTMEQIEKFNIPENPEKPGEYQWEALKDEDAEELILKALGKYLDFEVIEESHRKSDRLKEKWEPKVREALELLE